jgi:hypothetical protein
MKAKKEKSHLHPARQIEAITVSQRSKLKGREEPPTSCEIERGHDYQPEIKVRRMRRATHPLQGRREAMTVSQR